MPRITKAESEYKIDCTPGPPEPIDAIDANCRAILRGVAASGILLASGCSRGMAFLTDVPMSGVGHTETTDLDRWMREFAQRERVPGAALAITQSSKLVYARGFGYADTEAAKPVAPDSRFRIASVSKTITATAILRLVEQGKLSLDTRCVELLALTAVSDARWSDITVRHLLHHCGGWDEKKFDVMFESARMAKETSKPLPLSSVQVLEYMVRRPLDFVPGSKFEYSNFGYFLLGFVVEKASGVKYEEYVRQEVLALCGASQIALGKTLEPSANEVRYYSDRKAPSIFGSSGAVPMPYGAWSLELMAANGGWISSAVDLARFTCSFDVPPRNPILKPESIAAMYARPTGEVGTLSGGNYPGMGWFVWPEHQRSHNALATVNGFLGGTSTYVMRRRDGINWIVLFNKATGTEGRPLMLRFRDESADAINAVRKWPAEDQFSKYQT